MIDIFDPQLGGMLYGIQETKERTVGVVDFPIEIKMTWGNHPDCPFVIEVHEIPHVKNLDFRKFYNQMPVSVRQLGEMWWSSYLAETETKFTGQPITKRDIAPNDKTSFNYC